MERSIQKQVRGQNAIDGAGVHLVRVLGHGTVEAYDPFLMLDSFDSHNPADYIAGFPMHPHRGIETISFLAEGAMTHRDSIGNEDTVTSGEVQWMTAGSGIMHEEKLPASKRMLGVQLWLNMRKADKMASPDYHAIKAADIEEIPLEKGKLKLLVGQYEGHQGYQAKHLPLDYYDIKLDAGGQIEIKTEPKKMVLIFTLEGDAQIAGEFVAEKTALRMSDGDMVKIAATDKAAEILFMSSDRLEEPVAWGGPIVMNTRAELEHAFDELRNGTFLKESLHYEN